MLVVRTKREKTRQQRGENDILDRLTTEDYFATLSKDFQPCRPILRKNILDREGL